MIFSFPLFISFLLVTLCMWIILLDSSFEKISLILRIFSILPLNVWAYEQLFELTYDLLFEFDVWFLLKKLYLANTLLLGLEEIEGGILKILVYSSLVKIGVCISFLLYYMPGPPIWKIYSYDDAAPLISMKQVYLCDSHPFHNISLLQWCKNPDI